MKNYQKLFYQHYYAQSSNGEYVEVSRRECFAPPENPTLENPFKQRWFYDAEAGYAVRLERSLLGEKTYRASDTPLKREERHQQQKFQCLWKGTKNCDQECEHCKKRVSRTVELDKTYTNGEDGLESKFDLADEAADIAGILEDKVLLAALIEALSKLSPEDRELWNFLKINEKKQVIANKFNLTLDGVRYREQRLFAKLRSDKNLKVFFEKD
jgi:hypothetical protein